MFTDPRFSDVVAEIQLTHETFVVSWRLNIVYSGAWVVGWMIMNAMKEFCLGSLNGTVAWFFDHWKSQWKVVTLAGSEVVAPMPDEPQLWGRSHQIQSPWCVSWTAHIGVVVEERWPVTNWKGSQRSLWETTFRLKIRAMLSKEVISLEDLWHDASVAAQKGQDGHQVESFGLNFFNHFIM